MTKMVEIKKKRWLSTSILKAMYSASIIHINYKCTVPIIKNIKKRAFNAADISLRIYINIMAIHNIKIHNASLDYKKITTRPFSLIISFKYFKNISVFENQKLKIILTIINHNTKKFNYNMGEVIPALFIS